jgi:hypothetical protein
MAVGKAVAGANILGGDRTMCIAFSISKGSGWLFTSHNHQCADMMKSVLCYHAAALHNDVPEIVPVGSRCVLSSAHFVRLLNIVSLLRIVACHELKSCAAPCIAKMRCLHKQLQIALAN